MAQVYAVLDTSNGRKVALKRPTLQGSAEHQRRVAYLFAREFHAMSQLAHPRIVEVYDYGVDEHGPYYTMEILDGGDLQQLVPLDYRRLCEIARDVCSALSLLHSRRIVHRDLSPRNVRCTTSGVAKLIDFGAMAPMGPSKETVGTPAFCAPEVVNMQTLDARTDLYALGATLYFALTEHHAYPARDFASLQNAWRFALARPSELAADVPEALDALVLDLLQLDPQARPSNAAEVMERLSAIEGRPANTQVAEQLVVAQSYLATPSFVGRSEELARVHSRVVRALGKHGAVMLVAGERGSGRSRFLEACVLDAKLQGYMGLRADAEDGATGDYGSLRRILRQLQQMAPELAQALLAPELPVLGHVMPELLAGQAVPLASFAHPSALRAAVQDATQRVLLAAAECTPLLIAIDDLPRCDEPSLAALALFSRAIERTRIVILASAVGAELDKSGSTLKMLITNASTLALPSLSEAQSEELLGAIFGHSPELTPLARRLHGLSSGSPRDLMRLAQHLVDRGLARYAAGSWSLPAELQAHDLPQSVAQLLRERIARLTPAAHELGSALALSPDQAFSFEEARQLAGHAQAAALMHDLDALTQAEIVRPRGERFVLADRAWVAPLHERASSQLLSRLHLRLAAVFEQRADDAFRQAQHLLRGGEPERALDIFTAHAIESRRQTDSNPDAFSHLLRTLPGDWVQTYVEMLQLCEAQGRPKRDRFAIIARMGGIIALTTDNERVYLPAWLTELKELSGLGDFERADPALDPGLRLKAALEAAGARYAQLPEDERTVDPKQAIAFLSMGVRFVMQAAAPALDVPLLHVMPSLQPFEPLSPAMGVVERLRRGVVARVSGRLDHALETYRGLLERVAAPDGGGLDPTHVTYTLFLLNSAVAAMEASFGIGTCLERARRMESHVLFRVNAAVVRMLHALWQGDSHTADRERKHIEELRIQSGAHITDQTHLLWQVTGYAAMEDLTRLKQTLVEIAPLAERFEGWRPVEVFGKAEYQRIRGDCQSARELLAPVLERLRAGEHGIWPQLAAAHLRALAGSGQVEQALTLGAQYASAARAAQLGPAADGCIALAHDAIRAKAGHTDAGAGVEAAIAHAQQGGACGLPLGLAYEARAYVALFLEDKPRYEQFSALAEQELTRHKNPALAARLQRLKREAQRKHLGPVEQVLQRAKGGSIGFTVLKSRLVKCTHAAERAKAMLYTLAQRSGATRGFLFQVAASGPVFSASLTDEQPDPMLHAMVQDFVMAETQARAQNTGDGDAAGDRSILQTQWTSLGGDAHYRHVLLSHYNDSGYCVTGVAVFVVAPGQPFIYPGEAASQVSQLAHELGDATAILVDEEDDD